MIKPYNERHFCIELIMSQYKTTKVSFIAMKLESELGEVVEPDEIQDYINGVTNKETKSKKKSNTITMDEIFDRDVYEKELHEDRQRYLRHV